jgi:histidinol phosphatase-like PHP family hydrolase
MSEATRERGYSYLGLTDHSQTAHYAGGLTPDEVLAQQKAIEKLNKSYGKNFHVFKGIESDILGDGSLDYPDDILQTFDLVIASVHSKFRMGKKEQTDRIIKAIENPHTTILGHVTGRQLLRRPGYEVDMERILKACAKHGVAIEINAHPWRTGDPESAEARRPVHRHGGILHRRHDRGRSLARGRRQRSPAWRLRDLYEGTQDRGPRHLRRSAARQGRGQRRGRDATRTGALKRSPASFSLAVSGVLGPEEDEDGNPVGLVYFCCARSGAQPVVAKEEFGKQKPEQLLQLTIARAFDLIEECAGEPRAS